MPRAKLSNVSLKQLVAELKKRRAKLADLLARREAIRKALAEHEAIESEIKELQSFGLSSDVEQTPMRMVRRGRPPGKAGRKPGRKAKVRKATGKTLADYVTGVLTGVSKGLGVKEIEQKVLAAGYPTRAKTIYNPVMKVLAKGFKKVSRGVYALKKGAAAVETAAGPAKAPAAKGKTKGKRGKFSQTAEQLILGLVKGKGATTADLNKAWKAAGRAGKADVSLFKLVKAGKLRRAKLKEGKGSTYTLA